MGRIRKLYRAGTVFCVLRGVIGKPQKVHFWPVWAGLDGPRPGCLGTVQTGKSEVSGPSPGEGPETEVWARVPKPGPRGASPDAQKGGPQTPTFGPQAHYRPDGLLGPFPEPRFRDRSQGVLPKVGSGLETSVLDTLGLGRQTQTGGGCPELRLENPRSTLEGTPKRTPSEDPILRSV